jgi:hypothetical protein
MTRNPIGLTTRLVALGAVAVMTLAGGSPRALAGDHTAMKCGSTPERKDPHIVVDGRFLDRSPEEIDLKKLDILNVAIVCWDPVRRVFVRGPGEDVIHIITAPFRASIHADLTRVLEAQDAFHEAHARYGSDLVELGVRNLTEGIDIELVSADSGWVATARGELLLETCHIFAGEILPENGMQEPRKVECVDVKLPRG